MVGGSCSCGRCGRNEGASNLTAAEGEAPTGRMFQCEGCELWAHTECFARYRGLDDDDLPLEMWCQRCGDHAENPVMAVTRTPPSAKLKSEPTAAQRTPHATRAPQLAVGIGGDAMDVGASLKLVLMVGDRAADAGGATMVGKRGPSAMPKGNPRGRGVAKKAPARRPSLIGKARA